MGKTRANKYGQGPDLSGLAMALVGAPEAAAGAEAEALALAEGPNGPIAQTTARQLFEKPTWGQRVFNPQAVASQAQQQGAYQGAFDLQRIGDQMRHTSAMQVGEQAARLQGKNQLAVGEQGHALAQQAIKEALLSKARGIALTPEQKMLLQGGGFNPDNPEGQVAGFDFLVGERKLNEASKRTIAQQESDAYARSIGATSTALGMTPGKFATGAVDVTAVDKANNANTAASAASLYRQKMDSLLTGGLDRVPASVITTAAAGPMLKQASENYKNWNTAVGKDEVVVNNMPGEYPVITTGTAPQGLDVYGRPDPNQPRIPGGQRVDRSAEALAKMSNATGYGSNWRELAGLQTGQGMLAPQVPTAPTTAKPTEITPTVYNNPYEPLNIMKAISTFFNSGHPMSNYGEQAPTTAKKVRGQPIVKGQNQ